MAGIFSILTHGYIGEDNALLRVQSITAEPWHAEYADLIIHESHVVVVAAVAAARCSRHGRFKVSCSNPTHPCISDLISPLPFLCVTWAGDRVHLISTSPSIIGLCAVSERLSANLLRHISSSLAKAGELAESVTRSSLQGIITR